jgi:hypothetical protein
LIRRFAGHLWRTRPPLRDALGFALVWAAAIIVSTMASALLARHALPPEALRIAVIFGLGAAIAAPLCLWFVRALALRAQSARFAAAFSSLSLLTLAFTAFLFGYDFWWYFAQWHGDTFTRLWLIQLVFTFASATYQFLVAGLRLYVPFGVFALMAAALLVARRTSR